MPRSDTRPRPAPRRSLVLVLATLSLVAACEDDPAEPEDERSNQLTVVPSSITIAAGSQTDFDAEAHGEELEGVEWSITGDITLGTIQPDGLYIAPDAVAEPVTETIQAMAPGLFNTPATAEVTIVP